jgi:soluble lytic murein transglycosylase
MQAFIEAKNLEKIQPDKSCVLYQELAKNEKFVLQDLAMLKQTLSCTSPLTEPVLDFSDKPWLSNLILATEEKRARLTSDALGFVEVRGRLARLQKGQKLGLAVLSDTEKDIQKFSTPEKDLNKARERLLVIKQEMAPRFKIAPAPEDFTRVAQDYLGAREFAKARLWAQKVIDRKKSTLDELLVARKIRRSSHKLEQKTPAFLKALQGDWQWAEKQSRPRLAIELGLLYVRALWTADNLGTAKSILTQLEKKHQASGRLNEIYFVRGKMFEEGKQWAQAVAEYQKATLDLKITLDKKIQFAKAWSAWKAKDDAKVIESLEPLIALGQDDPFESARGLYWKSRALKRQNQDQAANAALQQLQLLDPVGFYGTISYHALNQNFPPLTVPKTPSEFQKSPLFNADYLQALYDVGELEILQAVVADAVKKVKPEAPPEQWLPVFLAAAKANSYLPLFSQISLLTPENRNQLLTRDPELLFPLDHKDVIHAASQKFKVSPELIFSIIRQESAFDTFARSPADALGLMQLLPSIASHYEKQVGFSLDHFEDLYKPEMNVPFGAALLRDLLNRYDGKIYLAAAAYNASEKALRTWLKMRWTGDVVEFIEEIPYEETRTYVKLITRNYAFYTRLLKSGKATPFPAACLEVWQSPSP